MEVQTGDLIEQKLFRDCSASLERALRSLLEADPTAQHLSRMLDHIHFWLRSRIPKEVLRAARISASLVHWALMLPEFKSAPALPRLGQHVAELAVCIGHHSALVSRQAREAIFRLFEWLQQQHGIARGQGGDLWCREFQQHPQRLAYINIMRVGEAFGALFSEKQRQAFLQSALLALHDPSVRVSEAGLLLVYSLLGIGSDLMRKELRDMQKAIRRQLHLIRGRKVLPEALQSLCAHQGDVLLEDCEGAHT